MKKYGRDKQKWLSKWFNDLADNDLTEKYAKSEF